jgi:DNA repair photolyase
MTKAKGNMYEFITHTWNPIKGKCLHDCYYCYMKDIRNRFNQKEKEPHLVEKEMKVNLGSGNFIFVGSSTDMWAKSIPNEWIYKVLVHTRKYPENTYLFQTKNPSRYFMFGQELPDNAYIGTTIETNREYGYMGNTPSPLDRAVALKDSMSKERKRFITIEPIIDFDIGIFVATLYRARPDFCYIGADIGNNHLPEPEPEKIRELIKQLENYTKVRLKKNLKRLLPEIT